jgi:glycosyltransferase involved in cell wall biosynthesis
MSAPLRVLLLGNYLPPRGGAETHLAGVEALLRGAGHAVEVHAPGEAGGWPDVRDRVHNPVVRRLVAERIAAFRPDVIHVHNFLRRLSTAPFRAAAAAGVPTLLTVHDYQIFCPRTWALRADGSPCPRPSLPLCLLGDCRGGLAGFRGGLVYAANAVRVRWAAATVREEATRIVAPSEALAARLRRTLRPDVGLLPYPFPEVPDAWEPPPSPDLLFLGRTAPEKGVLELLAALAAARRDGAALRLTVAGDGPLLGAARERAAALGLGDAVRFEGWVDAARVPDLLRAHGALVLPSVWMENSPVSVHEALAAGRPVLGSVRGGIPELVEDGASGFLFDPLDAPSFVRALGRWAALDAAGREALGRAARRRASEAGGPAGFLLRLLDEYRLAIQSAGAGR